jgi:hypothetical protein
MATSSVSRNAKNDSYVYVNRFNVKEKHQALGRQMSTRWTTEGDWKITREKGRKEISVKLSLCEKLRHIGERSYSSTHS